MADRDTFLGDADFVRIPYEGLLLDAYAAERRRLIDPERASLEFRPGRPEHFMEGAQPLERPLDLTFEGAAGQHGDTSYICVVDGEGNIASFVSSLYSGFGTGVIMGDLGFSLNARASYFSLKPGHANELVPSKRPRSTLQSSLVMKDGAPTMVLGSPGGDDQCIRTMQTFLNLVEFGMNIQEAIEAPRWSTRSFPASPFPHTMYPGDLTVEERIPVQVRQKLAAKGHNVSVLGAWSLGKNVGIVLDPVTGIRSAGADPRVEAYALAW